MSSDAIVFAAVRRTPIGAFLGAYSGISSPELGSVAIAAALKDAQLDGGDVDQVLMGCVLSAGL
ncbi:MAG TPA: acetyl-CoA C-acetyltransferase, partial [Woeseiaceae bacterium]|nr:acetyl-CoA C-acetyltransferase [Woeseiaceae bacterium]